MAPFLMGFSFVTTAITLLAFDQVIYSLERTKTICVTWQRRVAGIGRPFCLQPRGSGFASYGGGGELFGAKEWQG